MRKQIEEALQAETTKRDQSEALQAEFMELNAENATFYSEATGFTGIFEKYENLKKHKNILQTNREEQLEGMQVMTGESLYRIG
jgi:hypothetical protein